MDTMIAVDFEKALRLLSLGVPESATTSRKPVLFHAIRVAVFLYDRGYPREVVLAGLLHDALEWSTLTRETIEHDFGLDVLRLVEACTMDRSITDPMERTNELIGRCVRAGDDAVTVKIADVIDSFRWYARTGNTDQLAYCQRNKNAILSLLPQSYQEPLLDELHKSGVNVG